MGVDGVVKEKSKLLFLLHVGACVGMSNHTYLSIIRGSDPD